LERGRPLAQLSYELLFGPVGEVPDLETGRPRPRSATRRGCRKRHGPGAGPGTPPCAAGWAGSCATGRRRTGSGSLRSSVVVGTWLNMGAWTTAASHAASHSTTEPLGANQISSASNGTTQLAPARAGGPRQQRRLLPLVVVGQPVHEHRHGMVLARSSRISWVPSVEQVVRDQDPCTPWPTR